MDLSALVITYNEEANIFRTLDSIRWIPYVLVVDSGSTDSTVKIASEFSNTHIVVREFDSFANQCNFGLESLSSEWVLSLDADYVVTQRLCREIIKITQSNERADLRQIKAYSIRFQYCINGRPIRSGLLPPRTCLYQRLFARYIDEGHGHRICIQGERGDLKGKILHDDRKSVDVWLMNQKRYQAIEARTLFEKQDSQLPKQDLLRKYTCLAPFAVFAFCYIARGGILDGKEGIIYAFQRFITEALLYLNIHMRAESKSLQPDPRIANR